MKFYNTSASTVNSAIAGQVVMPPAANQAKGEGEYSLKEGEVILELRLGLGAKAKNSPNGIATLRGTDPVGGFYRNSNSKEVFMKVALSSFVYKNGAIAWSEDGLPETALVNGVLRVNQARKLSDTAQQLATYLATGTLFPVDPMSPQAEAVCNTPELQSALKELRGGSETRKEIMTRDAWALFRHQFFGGDYPVLFTNPADAEDWARELETLGERGELKDHTLVIGYRLTQGGQPVWTERDAASVGKRKGNKVVDTLIPGTEETLETRPVNVDIAYMEIVAVKNRVIDPSKTMNKEYFGTQLDAFLNASDKSSEGIGREVIEARRDKWASLKETLRGESGGKKKVNARKAAIRALAEAGTPQAIEELKQSFEQINQMVNEAVSPHWTAGVVASLLQEVNTSLGHDLYAGATPSKVETSVEPDELEEVEEETQGVVSLNPDDLEDIEEEKAATPEVAVASGSAAARLLLMRKAK